MAEEAVKLPGESMAFEFRGHEMPLEALTSFNK
jgi:hypothetical protein